MKAFYTIVLTTLLLIGCKKTPDSKSIVDTQVLINSQEVLKKELVLNQVQGK